MPADPSPQADAAARVVVVGGGVSGLVAARAAALAGARVALVEADDRLGGRIRAAELGDPEPARGARASRIDIGAEAFATRGGVVAALVAQLGIGSRIVAPSGLGSWVVDPASGRAVPLPPGGALGIPARPCSRGAVRALGVAGALRAAVEPLLPRAVDGRSAAASGEPTVGALVRARLGRRVLERVVRPVCLGVYSADPDALPLSAVPGLAAAFARRGSLLRAARELRDSAQAAGGAVAGLRGGMTELVEALAADAERLGVAVRTGERVASLAGAVSAGAAALGDADAAPGADAVILAVPERAARAILGKSRDDDSAPADLVEIVALAVDDARLAAAPRGTGALVAHAPAGTAATADAAGVAAPAPIRAKALTHVSAKWPHRAVGGPQILRLSYGRAGSAPETLGLPDAEARELAIADASRILGLRIDPRSVRGIARHSWQAGGPSRTGLPAPERARAGAAPAVVCAGDWVSGTGLASVVPGAEAAAARALALAAAAPADPEPRPIPTPKDPA